MQSDYQNYNLILENYLSNYVREYGERSSKKTVNIIRNSKHTANLLNQSSRGRFVPNQGDFNSFVLSNFSLTFAKTSKITFASIILLNYWHNDINLTLNLASESEIIHLFNRILSSTT